MAEDEKSSQPAASAAGSDAQTGAPAPKRNVKKGWIVGGVIAAVIIVAGAGFWVWHEQPSFCNSICHKPMDSYVESYYSGNSGMLVTAHAQAGNNCLSCHEPIINDQITEVMKWSGDTFEMTADGKHLAADEVTASEEFCARSGCHNMEDVVASTWGFEGNDQKYNPHSSHQDLALECGDCHKVHETSVLMCNQCHSLNMPEGWETPHDAAN